MKIKISPNIEIIQKSAAHVFLRYDISSDQTILLVRNARKVDADIWWIMSLEKWPPEGAFSEDMNSSA